MPAYNNWNVPYSVIAFFEQALHGHNKVDSLERTQDIYFNINDIDGRCFKVLLVNEYSLGLAAVLRAQSEFPEVEYIVTGGNWNGYTKEAKDYGRDNSLGIFNVGEFFGALNWTHPKKYAQKDGNGNAIYHYKNP